MTRFTSELIDLNAMSERLLIIPAYQRPYVWSITEVRKLLDDITLAFDNNDNHYYLGTIVTSRSDKNTTLVDGQQRFTTLWLIAWVISSKLGEEDAPDISKFLRTDDALRIDFEIRDEVKSYFQNLLQNSSASSQYSEDQIKKMPYLRHISTALTTIENYISEHFGDSDEKRLREFADYLFKRIKLVENCAPAKFDVNKFFVKINTSGIQLEQTDILKAKLLSRLCKNLRLEYSKIWEACEEMNLFFEQNVKRVFTETNFDELKTDDFLQYHSGKFKFSALDKGDYFGEGKPATISSIKLDDGSSEEDKEPTKPEDIYKCRSIISFGQLLLHTLRIWLHQNGKDDFQISFSEDRLIEIFHSIMNQFDTGRQSHGKEFTKEFIELLWEVRVNFDREVVKWLPNDETREEELGLTDLVQDQEEKDENRKEDKNKKNFYRRRKGNNPLQMLQSMLYSTGDTKRQYWLTPFLESLLKSNENEVQVLENIDNQLSLLSLLDSSERSEDKKDQKTASFALMNGANIDLPTIELGQYLNSKKGTGFRHYWFQKTEYLLWKNWNSEKGWEKALEDYPNLDRDKFKKYRITSRNSIEHIFPQQHEHRESGVFLSEEWLNDFGNLVLVTVSQNSSYSNQDIRKKYSDFDNKLTYDSLKLAAFFSEKKPNDFSKWGIKEIQQHRKKMIALLEKHYKSKL
ncbi:DUF262 domain-containing protein [Phaeodactylibacter xiamenensis]|uniref:DUF262 domain-containing protein n=1 Tax=Phaeodactylibacter xiamenensis TaxID=1524460 RepID=UPI0024A82EE1|nr:DUF262 domain-containing HNH endonuclease family protein [Phaeodactylibacter xiamenensis]